MRYIGSKKKLVNFIEDTVKKYCGEDLSGKVFCDLFAGTGSVGQHFHPLVNQIVANDFEPYSLLVNKVAFYGYHRDIVQKIVDHLNTLEGTTDSPIFDAYVEGGKMNRLYFTRENGMKLCSARTHIDEIRYLIEECDYDAVLASIMEAADKVANTAATYGAFMKDKEKHKACLDPIVFELPKTVVDRDNSSISPEDRNVVYGKDANEVIKWIEGDILYLDPPYNTRQYGSNYHVLNGIVTLNIQDKDSETGVPKNYNRSDYCSKRNVKYALDNLIANSHFEWIFLSYNNEGLLPFEEIQEIFSKYGTYSVEYVEYKRYKADNNRNNSAEKTCEYIHVLHRGAFSESEQSCIVDPARFMKLSNITPEERRESEIKKGVSEWGAFSFHMKPITMSAVSKDTAEKAETVSYVRPAGDLVVSPMNYMGGKKKLINTLLGLFPKEVDLFVDLFCGGATVGVNAPSKNVVFNDSIKPLVEMYEFMYNHTAEECLRYIDFAIGVWGLTQNKEDKDKYYAFRESYNSTPVTMRNPLDLFVLMAYSFNNQIRFAVNKGWKFNIPFGEKRSSFNNKMRENLIGFIDGLKRKNCTFTGYDFTQVDMGQYIGKNAFIYADPPYLISQATYNDGWDENKERELLEKLDYCNAHGIKFALSNVLENKGKTNEILKVWAEEKGYNVIHLDKSYSNSYYHRKERESKTDEVLITNYTTTDNV